RIDLEQHVALVDELAFLHHDLVDAAGDIRRDQNLLRADIRIVGADVAAAIEIERDAAGHGDDRQHHEQQEAAVTPKRGEQPAARRGRELLAWRLPWRALLLRWKFQYGISHSAVPS